MLCHFVHISRQSVVAVYITCSLYAKKQSFQGKRGQWSEKQLKLAVTDAEHSTF